MFPWLIVLSATDPLTDTHTHTHTHTHTEFRMGSGLFRIAISSEEAADNIQTGIGTVTTPLMYVDTTVRCLAQ